MKHTAAPTADLDIDRDGVIEITSQEQGTALAAHLLDPTRTKPMIVVSIVAGAGSGAGGAIDAETIYDAVTPLALVARVRNGPATYALKAALPPGMDVFGSAGRVYAGGKAWESDSNSILRIIRRPQQTVTAAEDLIAAALASGYTPTPDEPCNCDETKALKAQIRELTRTNNRLQSLLSPAVPLPRRPGPQDTEPVLDSATRFRAEVTGQWQQRLAQPDSAREPLPAGYPLHPDFLATLDRLTQGEYRKAASVAMEILTGLVHTVPGRNARLMRTARPGNNAHRRTDTGQLIWRANIQTHSPAARRIHWTRTPEGQIRLLAVTQHDDPLAA